MRQGRSSRPMGRESKVGAGLGAAFAEQRVGFGTSFHGAGFHAVGSVSHLMARDHSELRRGQGGEDLEVGDRGVIPRRDHGVQAGGEAQVARQLLVQQGRLGHRLADEVVGQPVAPDFSADHRGGLSAQVVHGQGRLDVPQIQLGVPTLPEQGREVGFAVAANPPNRNRTFALGQPEAIDSAIRVGSLFPPAVPKDSPAPLREKDSRPLGSELEGPLAAQTGRVRARTHAGMSIISAQGGSLLSPPSEARRDHARPHLNDGTDNTHVPEGRVTIAQRFIAGWEWPQTRCESRRDG